MLGHFKREMLEIVVILNVHIIDKPNCLINLEGNVNILQILHLILIDFKTEVPWKYFEFSVFTNDSAYFSAIVYGGRASIKYLGSRVHLII